MAYLIRKVRTSHIDGPPCFFKSDIPSFDNLRYKLEFSGQIFNLALAWQISALLFSFENEGMLGFCSSFQEVKEYYFYFQEQEFVKGFK